MRFAILAALTALVIPMSAKATEEPKYEVVTEDDKMQIRQYEPVIQASGLSPTIYSATILHAQKSR